MWLASMVSPSWENASDRPSATALYGFQAGLLTEVHPIRTPSQPKPVAYVRIVPITALGTWRSLTAFPILPRHRLRHLEAFTVWHGRYWPIQPRLWSRSRRATRKPGFGRTRRLGKNRWVVTWAVRAGLTGDPGIAR